MRADRRTPNGAAITLLGAKENNLKNLDVVFPLGVMTVVTGVSDRQIYVVNDILYRRSPKAVPSREEPGTYKAISGTENIDKSFALISRRRSHAGSNPATYTGVFSQVRDLYAMLPESRERGYKPGRFSFMSLAGAARLARRRTAAIEMNFLPDVYVLCEVWAATATTTKPAVKYKGQSIADVLECRFGCLADSGEYSPGEQKLQTLVDVGLGYIHLGQSAVTLSR